MMICFTLLIYNIMCVRASACICAPFSAFYFVPFLFILFFIEPFATQFGCYVLKCAYNIESVSKNPI